MNEGAPRAATFHLLPTSRRPRPCSTPASSPFSSPDPCSPRAARGRAAAPRRPPAARPRPRPRRAARRLSANAVSQVTPMLTSALTQSGALQQALQGVAGTSIGGVQIHQLSMGNPQVAVTMVQNGFETVIDIPNLFVDATLIAFSV